MTAEKPTVHRECARYPAAAAADPGVKSAWCSKYGVMVRPGAKACWYAKPRKERPPENEQGRLL